MSISITPPRTTVRKAYKHAIRQVFGCGDDHQDSHLLRALGEDVHLGGKAPGNWSPGAVLEIYCENGIPNASDVNDFSCYAAEAGCDPADLVSYNSESWFKVDDIANELLRKAGYQLTEFYYHEPNNSAVVSVYSM
jgi:hypothetical protein